MDLVDSDFNENTLFERISNSIHSELAKQIQDHQSKGHEVHAAVQKIYVNMDNKADRSDILRLEEMIEELRKKEDEERRIALGGEPASADKGSA